jgi:hypothetical protein
MSDRYGDDTGSETGFRRIIREAKEEAFHARRQLRRDQPSPSVETKRNVAAALSDYRDALYDYRDEGVLETPWDEREVNIDELDAYLSQTTTMEQSLNRRGGASEVKTVPLVAKVPAERLFRIGKELDSIAKELGFAASAKEQTPSDEASMSDLRGLLKARGQTEALENLPGGNEREEVAD